MTYRRQISHVYRAFDDRKSFEEFLAGQITLKDICSYRNIQNAVRRDTSEGTLEYSEEAKKREKTVLLDRCREARPAFILSTCVEPGAAIKFGAYTAEIAVVPFEKQLSAQVGKKYSGHHWKVFSRHVQYDKGGANHCAISADEIEELSLFQKSCEYAPEKEYRFVAELLDTREGRRYYFDRLTLVLEAPGLCIKDVSV